MTSLNQLEQETEATRARVADLLDELRARISPGALVDQVIDVVGTGPAGEFANTFGRQVRDNPLACALIGAGMAWLMLGGRGAGSQSASHTMADTADRATQRAGAAMHDMADAAGAAGRRAAATAQRMTGDAADTAGRAGSSMSYAAQRTGETVSGALTDASAQVMDRARDVASGMRSAAGAATGAARGAATTASDALTAASETLQGAARGVGRSASDLGRRAGDGITQIAQVIRDQPLIAAGFGLAIGAALGAALPATDLENRLVGENADELKARARAAAAEQAEKAKKVAERTYEVAKKEAGQVADEAVRAAEEEGFAAGTLRAEHEAEHAPPADAK